MALFEIYKYFGLQEQVISAQVCVNTDLFTVQRGVHLESSFPRVNHEVVVDVATNNAVSYASIGWPVAVSSHHLTQEKKIFHEIKTIFQ